MRHRTFNLIRPENVMWGMLALAVAFLMTVIFLAIEFLIS